MEGRKTKKEIPGVLTIPEVAELLAISRTQVYRLIDAGELVRIKIGTKLARITQESLASYIDRQALV